MERPSGTDHAVPDSSEYYTSHETICTSKVVNIELMGHFHFKMKLKNIYSMLSLCWGGVDLPWCNA